MDEHKSEHRFTMTEPGEYGRTTRFALWFTTSELRLLDFLETLACVAQVHPADADDAPVLVDLDDEFDPDEAWHWIRTDLEDELNEVKLDNIWYEAIRWLL